MINLEAVSKLAGEGEAPDEPGKKLTRAERNFTADYADYTDKEWILSA